jgi:hypothetical protein
MRNFGYNAGNVFFDFMQLRAVNKAIGQVNRAITPRIRYSQNQALDRIAFCISGRAITCCSSMGEFAIEPFLALIRFISSLTGARIALA